MGVYVGVWLGLEQGVRSLVMSELWVYPTLGRCSDGRWIGRTVPWESPLEDWRLKWLYIYQLVGCRKVNGGQWGLELGKV